MKKNLKHVASAALVLLTASCMSPEDVYQGTLQEQKDAKSGYEYAQKFSNFSEVSVQITSNYAGGRFYSIYAENPYSTDGELVAKPILSGLTPINTTISVPGGAERLYVVNDEGVKSYSVGALVLTDGVTTRSTTRTATETMTTEEYEAAVRQVNNQWFPERYYNVKDDDLYKCPDLYINNLTADQKARIWLTYVGTGGFNNNNKLWYYTYTKENPDLADCTFYGKINGEIKPVDFEEIRKGNSSVVSRDGSTVGKEFELPAEPFVNQTYVGFVFVASFGPRFTTPSLNTPENNMPSIPSLVSRFPKDYIGSQINYNATQSFTVDKRINSGAVFHFEALGNQYNVVGMENRLPNQGDNNTAYDADYNDLIVLVRSNPETIAPKEVISTPDLTMKVHRQGTWIFEDNYPHEGDYDFNDVVVAYDISYAGNVVDVTCKLVGKGCSNSNKFGVMLLPNKDGWKSPTDSREMWSGITGYFNVKGDDLIDLVNCETKTVRFENADPTLIRPYLDNGNGKFTLDTFNTSDIPYAMDIPSFGPKEVNTFFRWMKEGEDINDGYYFLKNKSGGTRTSNWFWNSSARDLTKTVMRTKDMTIW